VMKYRRVHWPGHVAGDVHNALVGRSEESCYLEGLSIGGSIILKWRFKNLDGEAWSGLVWLRQGQVVGCCECGNEPLGSTKCEKFLD
jgi:hypothetical protein